MERESVAFLRAFAVFAISSVIGFEDSANVFANGYPPAKGEGRLEEIRFVLWRDGLME